MYSKRNSVFPLPNTELPENKKTESRKSKHRKTPRVHQAEKREQVKGKIHEREKKKSGFPEEYRI